MKTYLKVLFVMALITWVVGVLDKTSNTGAYWFGYLIIGPLLWSLPIWGVIWVYNKLFNSKPANA